MGEEGGGTKQGAGSGDRDKNTDRGTKKIKITYHIYI